MSAEGVIINKGTPGANTLSGHDGETILIMHGVAVADKIALGDLETVYQLSDAVALGLDADYDETNEVRVYHHIKEFYRILTYLGVKGVPLHIMLVDNTLDGSNELNVTMEAILEDAGSIYAKKAMILAGGSAKLLGVAMNPAAAYDSTILDGLDADVMNSIPKAQGLANWAWDTNKPIHIFLEGREFSGTAAAAQSLRAIDGVEAGQVSVCVHQDWDYAETQNAIGKKYADIGTLLGVAAAIQVNENVGELERFNIQDTTKGAFVNVGISSHEKITEVAEDFDTYNTKGYIMGISYDGYDGIYFNDDHACAEVIIDDEGVENIHSISQSRTVNKLRRKLRTALLPKVKTTHEVDTSTGKLPTGKILYFAGIGDEVFKQMYKAGEISGGKTYVDPNSDLRTPPRTLKVDYSLVTTVSIGEIRGSINLKQSL